MPLWKSRISHVFGLGLYLGDEGRPPKLTAPAPALLRPALGDTEVVQAASVEQNP